MESCWQSALPAKRDDVLTSLGKSLQSRIAIIVAAGWIAYLIYLLTAEVSPELGDWAGPPHLTSSALLALALSSVLSPRFNNSVILGWWTLVTSTVFIVGFECLQLLTPTRTFEFIDISLGIAGAAIAAMAGVLLCQLMGRSAYVWLTLSVAVVVLIISLLLLRAEEPKGEISCIQPVSRPHSWDRTSVHTFVAQQAEATLVSSSIGLLCLFDVPQRRIPIAGAAASPTSENNSLVLNGAGLISGKLIGLREALAKSGEITFGIRFRTDQLIAGRPPRLVASLQSSDKSPALVARLLQNGPNATASFSFKRWQGSSTVLANRLTDQYHEVVLTYDGAVQTTYFDGSPVGTETTRIEAIDESGSELQLNIGKRTDRRWQPFVGEIDAIIIGAKSIDAAAVANLFNKNTND